jgi:hypothetical protein
MACGNGWVSTGHPKQCSLVPDDMWSITNVKAANSNTPQQWRFSLEIKREGQYSNLDLALLRLNKLARDIEQTKSYHLLSMMSAKLQNMWESRGMAVWAEFPNVHVTYKVDYPSIPFCVGSTASYCPHVSSVLEIREFCVGG